MAESGSATKRHNPVDSIRRKIKTIELRDQEPGQYLQIPKFQSRNFDSPQSSTKKNLEEVLKNRAMKNTSKTLVSFSSPGSGALFSPAVQQVAGCGSPFSSALYSACAAEQSKKPWSSGGSASCSTPLVGPRDTHFRFQSVLPGAECKGVILEDRILPSDPNVYYTRKSDQFTLRSPVVKRLSMSESTGLRRRPEQRSEAASEVSLICEEDLLNSIFYACDTEHRGKVAVSKIVDYLQYTTSRGSEDSGLSELCHMLDPERRDISMDLDTYHAIMKEWVDDCRNNGAENKSKELAEDSMVKLRESLLAVRRISGSTMNATSGSLEAFGGDVSRADLDTSDLITCIADLQYNNQKLQEQHSKVKAAIEAQEESNHRLLEENEELRAQLQSAQQSITVVRSMKVEIEDLKLNLAALEESKSKLAAQNKQMGKENVSLIHQISSLQEENRHCLLEAEEVRQAWSQVTDKAAALQSQQTDFENALQKKHSELLVKDLHIEEMKSALIEYSSVIENLRIEKSKLESSLRQMEQELLSNGINSPITYKLSRVLGGGLSSLHTELEYAQHSLEVSTPDWLCSAGRASSLDVTLDREVLLLLQEPGHEQMGSEFKTILHGLQEDATTMADQVVLLLKRVMESDVKDLSGNLLPIIEEDLRQKRKNWEEKLQQLEKYRESQDKEYVTMSGNLRRMKTEQVHLRKELSGRAQDLEAARHQQEEAEAREAAVLTQLQDSAVKHEDLTSQIEDLEISLLAVRSESEQLQKELEEARREQQELQAAVPGDNQRPPEPGAEGGGAGGEDRSSAPGAGSDESHPRGALCPGIQLWTPPDRSWGGGRAQTHTGTRATLTTVGVQTHEEMEKTFSKETCSDDRPESADTASQAADVLTILQRGSEAESKDGAEKENAAERSQDSGFNGERGFSRVLSCATSLKRSMVNINKPLVVLAVAGGLLVTLLGFLTGLSFHKPADGAPVETGVSWTSVQQLLWPYLGLRHKRAPSGVNSFQR
ncbi:inositol 1,4,5-triphosphate receptor associated 2 [Anomaloglossus baeobatrachus]